MDVEMALGVNWKCSLVVMYSSDNVDDESTKVGSHHRTVHQPAIQFALQMTENIIRRWSAAYSMSRSPNRNIQETIRSPVQRWT